MPVLYVFSKPCTKLTLHCNHRSGHHKTEHTESLFLLRRHLGNWPRSPAVSTSERTAGSAWETWRVADANGVRFVRVRWEINFLLTFETAPFICKHTVYNILKDQKIHSAFMDVVLFLSGRRYVSATHVISRVVRTKIQIYLKHI